MFWNFFKKKNKESKNPAPEVKDNAKPAEKKLTGTQQVQLPISFLQKLIPIGERLNQQELEQLSIYSTTFPAGSVIFNRGSEVESLIYLIKGVAFLESNTGSGQEIDADTMRALYPLSSDKLHHLTAIAKSDVTLIYLPINLIQNHSKHASSLNLPAHLKGNSFIKRFYTLYQQNNFEIPQLPDVALKLRKAFQQDIGIAEAAKIISRDPLIAAKLIQVVNSPIYHPLTPITQCRDAVNRLGLTTTRNLVTAFSIKNMIRIKQPAIKKRLQETWMQSVRISCISHTLARVTGKVDPEEALLAGLLHNIGVLPILMFADSLSEHEYQPGDIDICINEMQNPVGALVLKNWEFPENLKNIPLQTGNWFENYSPKLDLNDVVLLAKFHHEIAKPNRAQLPLISTLPAFQKLEHHPLTSEMSLQVLQDAKQEIAETLKFFMN